MKNCASILRPFFPHLHCHCLIIVSQLLVLGLAPPGDSQRTPFSGGMGFVNAVPSELEEVVGRGEVPIISAAV